MSSLWIRVLFIAFFPWSQSRVVFGSPDMLGCWNTLARGKKKKLLRWIRLLLSSPVRLTVMLQTSEIFSSIQLFTVLEVIDRIYRKCLCLQILLGYFCLNVKNCFVFPKGIENKQTDEREKFDMWNFLWARRFQNLLACWASEKSEPSSSLTCYLLVPCTSVYALKILCIV